MTTVIKQKWVRGFSANENSRRTPNTSPQFSAQKYREASERSRLINREEMDAVFSLIQDHHGLAG